MIKKISKMYNNYYQATPVKMEVKLKLNLAEYQ